MQITRRQLGLLSTAAANLNAANTEANPATWLADVISELQKKWPANKTVNIVCHGHSVPAGYFRTPAIRPFEAYPHLIHRGLNAAYPNAVINVINTSIGGENSKAGAARFERDVLTHQPSVVTIDYALNDRRLSLAEASDSWRAMVEAAVEKGVRVILLTPTADIDTNLKDEAAPLARHAAQIRQIAADTGVALADSFEAFRRTVESGVDVRYLLSQSNHPNLDGHQLVATEVLRWFKA